MTSFHLVLVSPSGGKPIFESLFSSGRVDQRPEMNQLVLHASLDVVDEMVPSSSSMYLRVVDSFHEKTVSAFVSPGGVRLLLLHDSKNEDGIKNFLHEVHEVYLRALLNPFQSPEAKIFARAFTERVRNAAKKHVL
jgi:trafficking protein particle complex subunit 2